MRPTCVDKIFELARCDSRVAYIGSDLDPPILKRMKAEMPGRAFMEGVSEQHVVGMAAGLAMEGFIPYVHTIATFITRRCYEQVAVDHRDVLRTDAPEVRYVRAAMERQGLDPTAWPMFREAASAWS